MSTELSVITARYNALPAEITRQSHTAKDWRKLLNECKVSSDNQKMTLQAYVERKNAQSAKNAKNRHDKQMAFSSAVGEVLPHCTDKYVVAVYPMANMISGNDAAFLQKVAKKAAECVTNKSGASQKVSLFVRSGEGYRQIQGGNFFNPKPLHVSDLQAIETLVLTAL